MNTSFRLLKQISYANKRILVSRSFCATTTQQQQIIDPPDDPSIKIPQYRPRENETLDERKARLIYQSRKRGMLENDLVLSTFAAKYLDKFTEKQLADYDKLINNPSNDWDIFNWSVGHKPTPEEYNNDVMDLLKEHVRNSERETRFRQPNLHK